VDLEDLGANAVGSQSTWSWSHYLNIWKKS
jgi:hypothetical protein